MKERKSLRLKGHDYKSPGRYFITICVKKYLCCFGTVRAKVMEHNSYGMIAYNQWQWLDQQYDFIKVRDLVVMPNHVHAVLDITPKKNRIAPLSLSQLVGAYKTRSCKLIKESGFANFSWHRSFYERIIRNEDDYLHVANYIHNNPRNWSSDKYAQH